MATAAAMADRLPLKAFGARTIFMSGLSGERKAASIADGQDIHRRRGQYMSAHQAASIAKLGPASP
jgi:hypothetical protein